ncbi:hypothetical protein HII31_04378 [Pseudocercospora fuligena]|uniref:Uncharacterized protein n=1 Tax=Pseudocercospora fuligena TaxID=685502 RepID=A0A8H6VPM8_9PEZI|nr:hypothetical protein HII31_04378 [Pseudocercospora fuligena]
MILNTETSTGHINVRINLRTPSGAGIYVHYDGMMKVDEMAYAAVMGTEKARTTRYGDHELFATPIMETGDENWKWIESAVWVAEGRFEVEEDGTVAIEYEVYKVNKSETQA